MNTLARDYSGDAITLVLRSSECLKICLILNYKKRMSSFKKKCNGEKSTDFNVTNTKARSATDHYKTT